MQAVPFPNQTPGTEGYALSINNSGMIVGQVANPLPSNPSLNYEEPPHAFLSDGHTSWDLNTLGRLPRLGRWSPDQRPWTSRPGPDRRARG